MCVGVVCVCVCACVCGYYYTTAKLDITQQCVCRTWPPAFISIEIRQLASARVFRLLLLSAPGLCVSCCNISVGGQADQNFPQFRALRSVGRDKTAG